MKRIRRILPRLLLAFAAPFLALILIEGAARLAGWGHPTRFLQPWAIEGRPVWIDNPIFGYRFFAPAVTRTPAPLVIDRAKATNEFRVVVLGESAAMGEPEPAFGPARMLEFELARRWPDRKVRVINAAMTAINSHVIREIARELPRLQPDAVVLYIGNNEVVGPFGPGTVFDAPMGHRAANRLRVLLTRSRAVSAFRAWRGREDQQTWEGMEMFAARTVAEDDPRLALVYGAFEDNLRAIVNAVEQAGAVPVICTVAVNLADQAPFDGSAFPADQPDTLAALRDADRLRFRADSTINAITRRVAGERPAARLVDVERVWSADGPPGRPWFIDHVHFSVHGAHRLASMWRDAIAGAMTGDDATPYPLDLLLEVLGWNAHEASVLSDTMLARVARPPFTATADNTARRLAWTRTFAASRRDALALSPIEAASRRELDWAVRPYDVFTAQLIARWLMDAGAYNAAIPWIERLRASWPHRPEFRSWQLIANPSAIQPGLVWTLMTGQAPDLGALPVDALMVASEELLRVGHPAAARDVLLQAVERYPRRLKLQTLFAARLRQAGDEAGSRRRMEHLLTEFPDSIWLREEYGILLAMAGEPEAAAPLLAHLEHPADDEQRVKQVRWLLFRQQFIEAEAAARRHARERPQLAPAWDILAALHEAAGRTKEAVAARQRVAELQPWNPAAWIQLARANATAGQYADATRAYETALPLLADPEETARVHEALASLRSTTNADVNTTNEHRSPRTAK